MIDEDILRMALMRVDIVLKAKQTFWETPRNLFILVGAVAALAGVLGFKIGQKPSPPFRIEFPSHITVQLEKP